MLGRRVAIVGNGGAGKTWFATRLAGITGLPLIHLDFHHWNAGWRRTPKPEWRVRHSKLLAGDEWIVDGNYDGTMSDRLERADTAIFFDPPTAVCLAGILLRRIAHGSSTGPDIPPGCPDRLDANFIRYVAEYRRRFRPRVIERLAVLRTKGGRVVHLRSRAAGERLLAALSSRGHDRKQTGGVRVQAPSRRLI